MVSRSSHGSSTEPVLHIDTISSRASIVFIISTWEEGCTTGISSGFRRNIHQPLNFSEGWSQSLNECYWVGEKVLLGSSLIWYRKPEWTFWPPAIVSGQQIVKWKAIISAAQIFLQPPFVSTVLYCRIVPASLKLPDINVKHWYSYNNFSLLTHVSSQQSYGICTITILVLQLAEVSLERLINLTMLKNL